MAVLGKEPSPTGCTCRWLCCGVASLVVGLLLLLIGAFAAALNHRFTPVYRDIQCQVEMPVVKRVWFDVPILFQGMHLELVSTTVCTNPNPYGVRLTSSKAGGIYMGENRNPVGNITSIPAAELAAGSTGKIQADLLITPTAEVLGSAVQMAFGQQQVPLYLENNLDVDVDVEVFFAHIKVKRSISKDCGMNLQLQGLDVVTGPMSCADSWDELVLQDADASGAAPGVLDFSAEGVGGEDVAEAESLKTTCLGAMMGLGFGLGLVLLVAGGLCLVHARRLRRREARAVEAKPPAPAPHAAEEAPARMEV